MGMKTCGANKTFTATHASCLSALRLYDINNARFNEQTAASRCLADNHSQKFQQHLLLRENTIAFAPEEVWLGEG